MSQEQYSQIIEIQTMQKVQHKDNVTRTVLTNHQNIKTMQQGQCNKNSTHKSSNYDSAKITAQEQCNKNSTHKSSIYKNTKIYKNTITVQGQRNKNIIHKSSKYKDNTTIADKDNVARTVLTNHQNTKTMQKITTQGQRNKKVQKGRYIYTKTNTTRMTMTASYHTDNAIKANATSEEVTLV